MKRSVWTSVAAACCASFLAFGCEDPGVAEIDPDLAAPRFGEWGFDPAGMDLSVSPGDDFYRYAVGTAYDALVIPPDRAGWGPFTALRQISDARVRDIIEDVAEGGGGSAEARKIGDMYASFLDEEGIEERDLAPAEADLEAIRAASTREDLARLMGEGQGGYYGSLFSPFIYDDQMNPDYYTLYLNMGGLNLPDRDYYLEDRFAEQKTAYQAYVEEMLGLIGWDDPAAAAEAVVAYETAIAETHWPIEDRRDDEAMYNPRTPDELKEIAPSFPWDVYLEASGLDVLDQVVVGEVTALPQAAAVFAETDIDTLKAWQAFTTIDEIAPFLSSRFVDAEFNFWGKTLQGLEEQRPRWQRGVRSIEATLGEAVGKIYVERYFPPEHKAQMEDLVDNLKRAMGQRIMAVDWMGDVTRAEAMRKLEAIAVKVGYPDKWRDYSGLEIAADDLVGNMRRSAAFEWDYDLSRLGEPVDEDEWGMTPQTVNAYYNSTRNVIVFPAAILQPPFFDPDADMAVNYGAIGGVIGHEISHGFDDQGRKSDADGYLNDWWTEEDGAAFESRARVLGAQFAQFEPVEGHFINADLTMGENIGDLGGMLVALEAYHMALGGEEAPVIDGFTGDQRFFLSWAQMWLAKDRDGAVIQQLASDPHSPDMYRVLGPVPNIDAFYTAFNVEPGAQMYLPPEERARIW